VDTEVTVIGGYLYPRTGVTLGPRAEAMLEGLRAAQVVMSCAAIGREGLFNVNEMMTAVERRMIAAADEVIVAADHTKFGKRAIAELCGWSDVDVLVSDTLVGAEDRGWLAETGVEVVLADPAGEGTA
jgi:DeoR/GlpR family transcriptional regulator of sugar metabolism